MKNTVPPLSPAESFRYYRARVPKLHKSGSELRAPCPIHHGKRDSFAVKPETGEWFCHSSCARGGSIFDFESEISGVDFKHAREEIFRIVGRTSSNGSAKRIVGEYNYADEKGKLLFQCVRYVPKDFKQRRPNGRGGWIWNLEGVCLVLYRLPEILAAPIVFVVEGEKDADALVSLGLVATCNPMGAGKWRKEYAETLRAKQIIVIPDDDEPGRKHAAAVLRSLEGVARSVKLLQLSGAKDASEWIERGGTLEALTHLVEQSARGAQSRAPRSHTNGHPIPELAPIPERPVAPRGDSRQSNEPASGITPGVVPWPAPIGEAGMFGLAGDFVRLVQKDTEADPNILLLTFLVYSGNMLGRTVYSTAGGDKHCTNLYLSIVGTTSHGRKGSALSVVEAFFLRGGGGRAPGLANVLYGISSGEGLIWEIRDPITKEECDRKTGKIATITVDQGNKDKRLLVSLGEFFQCLAAMRRKENSLSSLLRTAWDRDVLQSPVKNSPAKATGAHFSMVACISRDELLRAIDTGDADNGTLNRFLWACSKRSRLLPQGGKLFQTIESAAWGELQARFNRILASVGDGAVHFSRDAEADADWGFDDNPDCGLYRKLTEQRTGMWGSITARSAAQVLRLSLLVAALNGSRVIGRVHQEAALEIWRYCEQSAKYIFGDRLDDPIAQAIMLTLRDAGDAGLTRQDVSAIWQGNKDRAAIQASLIWLSGAGLVRCEKRDEGTRGRPSERWFAL